MKRISLPHRKILRFVGKDAQSFIQGLFSNDVLGFSSTSTNNNNNNNIVYGAFLNGNGRVVTDGFVFFDKSLLSDPTHGPTDELFAEIDGTNPETAAKVLRHLEAFKMRADVKMSLVDDVTVHVELNNSVKDSKNNNNVTSENLRDPRSSLETVSRIYHRQQMKTTNSDNKNNNNEVDDYFKYLYERGICEGDRLWSQIRLPFEGNLDIVGGIHYRKGCYIGQELVQRAKTQLVSKKRIVPFRSKHPLSVGTDLFNDNNNNKNEAEKKTSRRPAPVGKVIDCIHCAEKNVHVGVCSLRLAESLNPETLEATLTTSSNINEATKVTANVPFWWPDDEIDKCIPLGDAQQEEQAVENQ